MQRRIGQEDLGHARAIMKILERQWLTLLPNGETEEEIMSDSKYGRLFTESDVEKIIEFLYDDEYIRTDNELTAQDFIGDMDAKEVRFKFPVEEPIFVLRGRDKRALPTIISYLDNQSHRAPVNHIEGIKRAIAQFEQFSDEHSNLMKEPD